MTEFELREERRDVVDAVLAAIQLNANAVEADEDGPLDASRERLWDRLERMDKEKGRPTGRKGRPDLVAGSGPQPIQQELANREKRVLHIPRAKWKYAEAPLPDERFLLQNKEGGAAVALLTATHEDRESSYAFHADVNAPLAGHFRVSRMQESDPLEKPRFASFTLNFLDYHTTKNDVPPTYALCKRTAVHASEEGMASAPLAAFFDRRCKAPQPRRIAPYPALDTRMEEWAKHEGGDRRRRLAISLLSDLKESDASGLTRWEVGSSEPAADDPPSLPSPSLKDIETINLNAALNTLRNTADSSPRDEIVAQLMRMTEARPVDPRFAASVHAYVGAHWANAERRRAVRALMWLESAQVFEFPPHGTRVGGTARARGRRAPRSRHSPVLAESSIRRRRLHAVRALRAGVVDLRARRLLADDVPRRRGEARAVGLRGRGRRRAAHRSDAVHAAVLPAPLRARLRPAGARRMAGPSGIRAVPRGLRGGGGVGAGGGDHAPGGRRLRRRSRANGDVGGQH